MGFRSSILAGTSLIRQAIKSPNYQSGIAGWSINRDGTAEFSDLLIRSSDGSASFVTIANGEITIRNAANVVVSRISAAGYKLYHPVSGLLMAESTLSGGPDALPGFVAYSQFTTDLYSYLGNEGIYWGSNVDSMISEPQISTAGIGDGVDPVEMFITGGRFLGTSTTPHIRIESKANPQNAYVQFDGLGPAAATDVDITGGLTVGSTAYTAYVPVMTGGGTATFTLAKGWYYELGDDVHVNAEFVVGVAGSGGAIVTVSLPSMPFRDGGTSRQVMPAHSKGLFTGGMASDGCAVIMETGVNAVIDQLALSGDNALNRDSIVTGVNLLAGARLTVTGSYRKA